MNRRPHFYSGALTHFAQELDRLASNWNRRVNVESRKSMYASRKAHMNRGAVLNSSASQAPEQSSAIASYFTWRELESRFRDIQTKAPSGQNVRAYFTRTEWDSGPASEEWIIGGNPASQKEFEHLATIAARKLGYAANDEAHKDWLGRVREWMEREGLDKDRKMAVRSAGTVTLDGRTGKTWGLDSEKIADLSAMLCMKLMARGTPELADSGKSREGDGLRRNSTENAKIAGGGLLAARRRTRRKAQLEEHLRDFASISMISLPLDPKEREEKQKLYDAIREVAVPAIDQLEREDQLKREEAANRIPRLMGRPITIPDSLAYAPLLEGGLLKARLESLPASKPKARRTAKALTSAERKRRKVIFGAIQAALKGQKYCSELDSRRLPPPWRAERCPSTYTLAYKDSRWRKRIQDEKCRFRERFDQISPQEREAIIDGKSGTRHTRRRRVKVNLAEPA